MTFVTYDVCRIMTFVADRVCRSINFVVYKLKQKSGRGLITGKPWPRLFQNLRASCETDWVEKHPAHECAAWLGHSPAIAAAHYLQARNHHFEAVVNAGRKSSAESSAPTAQNRAQQASATSRNEPQDGTETNRSPRVITVLPNKTGVVYKRIVGPVGLEPTAKGL